MTETLLKLPSAPGLYVGALRTARRKPGKNIRISPLEVNIAAVHAEPRRLAAYRDICGFELTDQLPITFPQVQAGPLHLWLMLRPEFPIPLMGLVHVRNSFEMLAPMPADGAYDVRATLAEGRRIQQGYEFDIATEYRDAAGQRVYRSLMTILYRIKSAGVPRQAKPQPAAAALSEYRSFDAPADIGRRYAPIGGDFNPIHLYALTAKAFGFPRAIAHGMWSVARAAALLESTRDAPAKSMSVQFRQPLLLPGKVALKFNTSDTQAEFVLLSRTSDKLHFSGTLS